MLIARVINLLVVCVTNHVIVLSQSATLILRIDDVLSGMSKKKEKSGGSAAAAGGHEGGEGEGAHAEEEG